MGLEGVVLLAAPGPRAKAYLQALVTRGLAPALVVIMGGSPDQTPSSPPHEWQKIFFPDPGESLLTTCGLARIPYIQCPATSVNDPELLQTLAAIEAQLVIYCGPGGQLAGDALLSLGPPFLHLHSGWLPDFRGSTTLYYALLEGQLPGVTAFFLDRTIDTGPVLARRQYPRPPAGMDVDRCYDPAIRADLLVQVMREFSVRGSIHGGETQPATSGRTYYVIHPVLKHIALLSLETEERP
jgi:methionyl-tRNA formyltransferase